MRVSQASNRSGSRRVGRSRQALTRATWTASSAWSTSRRIRYAMAIRRSPAMAIRPAYASSSPAIASSTSVRSTVVGAPSCVPAGRYTPDGSALTRLVRSPGRSDRGRRPVRACGRLAGVGRGASIDRGSTGVIGSRSNGAGSRDPTSRARVIARSPKRWRTASAASTTRRRRGSSTSNRASCSRSPRPLAVTPEQADPEPADLRPGELEGGPEDRLGQVGRRRAASAGG